MNPNRKIELSIVVLCLNEQENLKTTVRRITSSCSFPYEIIIVNDGSTDKTGLVANDLALTNQNIKVIHHDTPQLPGACVKKAINIAQGTFFIEIHGKADIHESEIKKIFSLRHKADIIVPYQLNFNERTISRRLVSSVFTQLVKRVSQVKLRYFNHYVLYRTELLRNLEIKSKGYTFQAELLTKLVQQNKLEVIQIGVNDIFESSRKSRAFSLPNAYSTLHFICFIAPSKRFKAVSKIFFLMALIFAALVFLKLSTFPE